jgi:hypothetical protein
MDGSKGTGLWEAAQKGLGSEGEKLDRALVAGLLLEVVLETAGSPADPQTRRRLVKARLKATLVTHLAGRVNLDRFHHLLRKLDHWFPLYYPLITAGSTMRSESAAGPGQGPSAPPAPPPLARRALRRDRLRVWLNEQGRDLLPRRPQRKFNVGKLWEFLVATQGGWFRLKDLQQHFGVDRKTAWEYLYKLRRAGLLRHNRGRSAAVRYALETSFLAVRAEALGIRVREALSSLPPHLVDQVCQDLIAGGGEAFWEEDWHTLTDTARRQEVISLLSAAEVLKEAGPVGERRKLKLARRWLYDQDGGPS